MDFPVIDIGRRKFITLLGGVGGVAAWGESPAYNKTAAHRLAFGGLAKRGHCTPVQSALSEIGSELPDRESSNSTCGPSIAFNPYMLTVKHQG